jgi:hypothetical protein
VVEYRLLAEGKSVAIRGRVADACFLILRGAVSRVCVCVWLRTYVRTHAHERESL